MRFSSDRARLDLQRSIRVVLVVALVFGVEQIARAGDTECADYGRVVPDAATLFVGQDPFEFSVAGGAACGDVETCEWFLEEDHGTVSPETGSPVEYTAPTELEGCDEIEFRLFVTCADAGTTESANITLRCTDEQDQGSALSSGTAVGGGGCGSPGWGLVLLPLGFGGRRRRKP